MYNTMTVNYDKKLNGIRTTFSLASDEYVNNFANAKVYPNVDSYTRPWNSVKQSLEDANGDLFALDAQLNSDISKLSTEIVEIDKRIAELRAINVKLEQQLQNMVASDNAASGRYQDSKQTSYLALYRTLVLSVIAYLLFDRMRRQTIS